MAGWNWNPFNRGGGMDDGASEEFFDRGGVRETVFDGGPDTTTTYDSWAKYDAGQPSGSYNWGGGYQGGMANNWAKAYDVAKNYNSKKNAYTPGYVSGGSFGWPSKGVTPLSASTKLVQPFPDFGKNYQIYNPPQKQGGGFLGTAMKIGSYFAPPGVREGLAIGSQFV